MSPVGTALNKIVVKAECIHHSVVSKKIWQVFVLTYCTVCLVSERPGSKLSVLPSGNAVFLHTLRWIDDFHTFQTISNTFKVKNHYENINSGWQAMHGLCTGASPASHCDITNLSFWGLFTGTPSRYHNRAQWFSKVDSVGPALSHKKLVKFQKVFEFFLLLKLDLKVKILLARS